MRRLRAYAEALCRRVAPDTATGPFYAVLRSDLPPEYQGGDGGALALTSRHLDLILRPTLERQRRWRGRGPAILLDPAEIAAGAARRPRPTRVRIFPPVAMGVVLHELAHIIDAGPRDDAEPDRVLVEFGRLILAADLTGAAPPTNGPGADMPWRGHEASFVRIALHLAHRAHAAGVDIRPDDVFDAGDYGLSVTRQYHTALGDEPERLAGVDFATIVDAAPPAAFTDLWRADVERWHAANPPGTDVHQALARGGR